MKHHKWQRGLVLATITLLAGAMGAIAAEQDGYQQIEEGGIRMMWAIDGDILQITIVAPTTGWIGIGFDPERKMKGANFIIGCVKDGKAEIEDQYGIGTKKHTRDTDLGGKDDVQDAGGKETDGTTELSFKIPLDSGDEYDKKLAEGQTVTVLLAYGKDDDTSTKHRQVIQTSIKL